MWLYVLGVIADAVERHWLRLSLPGDRVRDREHQNVVAAVVGVWHRHPCRLCRSAVDGALTPSARQLI